MSIKRNIIVLLVNITDILLIPFVFLSGIIFWLIRRGGSHRTRYSTKILKIMGIFPIRRHFYEPLFDDRALTKSLREDRLLPFDINMEEQLLFLSNFHFKEELLLFPENKPSSDIEFYYNNTFFMRGDSEFYYSLIRYLKPKNIIEIGSGNSTLMAINAIRQNEDDNSTYNCNLLCIEPYERKWLEQTSAEIVRSRLELTNHSIFEKLESQDILFIDSSHIIRPQGDVLTIFFEILPKLKKGVFIHIHDIHTPKDYPDEWIREKVLFANEQYLLEAFLAFNKSFKIISGLNFLYNNHFDVLKKYLPKIEKNSNYEPSSFWIQKIE